MKALIAKQDFGFGEGQYHFGVYRDSKPEMRDIFKAWKVIDGHRHSWIQGVTESPREFSSRVEREINHALNS